MRPPKLPDHLKPRPYSPLDPVQCQTCHAIIRGADSSVPAFQAGRRAAGGSDPTGCIWRAAKGKADACPHHKAARKAHGMMGPLARAGR